MIGRTMSALSFVAMFLTVQVLHAQGVVFVQQEVRNGKTETNRMQLDKTKMRAESHASGANSAILFDAKEEIVRMLDLDKKTYVEMNRAQIDQMRQQVGGAIAAGMAQIPQMTPQMQAQMAAAQAQLQNLPPDQRAAVAQMLEQAMGRGGAAGAAPRGASPRGAAATGVTYRRNGSDKIGQWDCAKYDGFRDQEKVKEVCAADPQVMGLQASDFDVVKQLANFLKVLNPLAADDMVVFGTPEEQGFAGVPVRQTTYANGKVVATTEIKELRRETLPASTFDVPSGFRRESMTGAR